jgi:hypothetical protein
MMRSRGRQTTATEGVDLRPRDVFLGLANGPIGALGGRLTDHARIGRGPSRQRDRLPLCGRKGDAEPSQPERPRRKQDVAHTIDELATSFTVGGAESVERVEREDAAPLVLARDERTEIAAGLRGCRSIEGGGSIT